MESKDNAHSSPECNAGQSKLFQIKASAPLQPQLENAAELLARNKVVAFPTETVYGLGGNALSDDAIKSIFQAKGRPSDNPLIVHISDLKMLDMIAEDVSPVAKTLMAKFWPGPLTIVLKSKKTVSKFCTAGLDSVGVRMPNHPVALELIRLANLPIAAPSANKSGSPSPTQAIHVTKDLGNRIPGIVDGGATGIGVESTVIKCWSDSVTNKSHALILRPGGVTAEDLKEFVDCVSLDPAIKTLQTDETSDIQPISPGMKYTHYAPDAPLYIAGTDARTILTILNGCIARGKRVGVMATSETCAAMKPLIHDGKATCVHVVACGSGKDLHTVARDLYASLRAFNDVKLDLILAQSFNDAGIGQAVMNRLTKAAGGRVLSDPNQLEDLNS